MFTIKELIDKRADYQSACYLTIKELLSESKSIKFDVEDVEGCSYCIGDNHMGIVDGIIKEIYINDNDEIIVCYVDNKDLSYESEENIKYMIHIDLIDVIENIKNKLKNG